jgi:Membrane dipeptidase (Peptidase family M19)
MKAEGVRTMFLAHWVDNALAGAALEGGDKGSFIAAMELAQTGHAFQTGPCPHPGQGIDGACNTKGLTGLGAYAVRRLMRAHVLIEVDHLSERARDQVLAIAGRAHYPVVSSHTGTGGTWVASELRQLYAAGGFASARSSRSALTAPRGSPVSGSAPTPVASTHCRVPTRTRSSTRSATRSARSSAT